MNIWVLAKEQTDKDQRTFEDIVKPKLLTFYKVTGEDITINLNDYGEYDKPVIHFVEGNHINIDRLTDPNNIKQGYQYNCSPPLKSISVKYDEQPNIKVVRIMLDNWVKIVEALDKRVNEVYKEVVRS
jgi:hypothetical protein